MTSMNVNNTLDHLLSCELDIPIFGHIQCGENWGTPARTVPEDLVYVIEAGVCGLQIDGKLVQFHPGSAFWLPAHYPHSLQTIPKQARPRVYHLRFVNPHPAKQPLFLTQALQAQRRMAQFYREFQVHDSFHELRCRSSLILLLTTLLNERSSGQGLTQAQQQDVHQYLASCPADARPDSQELAAAVGLSTDWFCRQFKRSFAMSPRSWLKEQRLQRAAARLADSSIPIHELAKEFGYHEAFRFSRQFREVLGMSPSQWRQQHGAPRIGIKRPKPK